MEALRRAPQAGPAPGGNPLTIGDTIPAKAPLSLPYSLPLSPGRTDDGKDDGNDNGHTRERLQILSESNLNHDRERRLRKTIANHESVSSRQP